MPLFHAKVALVTGAASGIGRAAALAFSREGAAVVVSDLHLTGAEATAAMIVESGGEALAAACDVARRADVENLVAQTVHTFGRLDFAFNNAGIGGALGMLHQKTEAEWDDVLAVNLKGVWLCLRSEVQAMQASGGGAIVNMASAAGLVGFRGASAYSASKHGVIGLTKTAALEYARSKIRVNAVCPGFTDTPMVASMLEAAPELADSVRGNPLRRLGTPEETAEAVIWLCSDKASFITGQALAIDGGLTAM
ncbi:MAG: short-chain dehydrogenase/reductase SDR [Chloroflexi bacterium OLB15]|nr:MAG: short-chain dehydrogenase/reductase SDR [Chloroflexi bacterium OLB15]